MCGACGAGSARTAGRHWSAPFLASVPARSAAARSLTAWSRGSGWSGSVSGMAGGFETATASGRRSLAADLAGTLDQLQAYGLGSGALLEHHGAGFVEGPPTWPGLRSHATGSSPFPERDPSGGEPDRVRLDLPFSPRRRYRVPALLAWLAVAERGGTVGEVLLRLDLGETGGLTLKSREGVVTCEATAATGSDVLIGDPTSTPQLLHLLGGTG
ncbi:MAG TPA: hypothetical protein VIT20_05690 [Propionibacteriaceae bacterium]